MPMYNFACEQCGQQFEELVAYDRRQDVTCPACQGRTKVLLSKFAVKTGGGTGVAAAKPASSPFS